MQSVYNLFYETLIAENRWMLIFNGLWATVVITLLSLLFGTLLGGVVYFLSIGRKSWMRRIATVWRFIVRGTPLLVLLLFFFYVVLSGGNGLLAAVVAFSINFSNLACSLIQSSVESVGPGQVEAGRALGFNNWQTLRYIVLPQALHNALPAYRFQAVSMVKSTSIVGYVAIQDLTHAFESIRQSTSQSLLPLIIVTIIYFILAWLLNKLLDYIAAKTSRI